MRRVAEAFQCDHVNPRISDANGRAVQVALRDLQARLRDRRLWIALVALGGVLGLFGPFDTAGALRTLPRIAYWLPVTLVTFTTGIALSALAAAWLRDRGLPGLLAAAIGGAVAGGPVAGLVLLMNKAALGLPLATPANLTIALTTVSVSAVVAVTVHAITGPAVTADVRAQTGPVQTGVPIPTAPPSASHPPALLARLPLDKRGPLVSLSATDHYTEVTTTRGRDLILIRLADAIAEAAPTPGLQVHRSHWVARDHVTAVRRRDAGAEVTLSDGRVLPVSRSNIVALKEAGLLPR